MVALNKCDSLTEAEIKKFIEAFNEFVDQSAGFATGELAVLQKQKAPIQRVVDNIKRAVMEGADTKTFVKELTEHQSALDELDAKIALLQSAGAVTKLELQPEQSSTWINSLRELIVRSDFDLRRELVRRTVKSVVIGSDKTAKMTWDLPTVMSLIDGKEVPVTTLPLEGFDFKALRG